LTEGNRNKILPYFSKITKGKKSKSFPLRNNNFPFIRDYWERVVFSDNLSSFYQKSLVSQLRKKGFIKKNAFVHKSLSSQHFQYRDRKDYWEAYWKTNKD
jgi:hypothetical protein